MMLESMISVVIHKTLFRMVKWKSHSIYFYSIRNVSVRECKNKIAEKLFLVEFLEGFF